MSYFDFIGSLSQADGESDGGEQEDDPDAIIPLNDEEESNNQIPDDETQDKFAIVKEVKESFGYWQDTYKPADSAIQVDSPDSSSSLLGQGKARMHTQPSITESSETELEEMLLCDMNRLCLATIVETAV